jgi:hypothetical protein
MSLHVPPPARANLGFHDCVRRTWHLKRRKASDQATSRALAIERPRSYRPSKDAHERVVCNDAGLFHLQARVHRLKNARHSATTLTYTHSNQPLSPRLFRRIPRYGSRMRSQWGCDCDSQEAEGSRHVTSNQRATYRQPLRSPAVAESLAACDDDPGSRLLLCQTLLLACCDGTR